MAAHAITKPGADVTVPETSWDHGALVALLEGWELACANPTAPDRRCEICPEAKVAFCHGVLRERAVRVQTFLLDHFQRENDLMNSLPATAAAKTHCVRHRREHVNFSTLYNLVVADLAAFQPAIGAARLEALVIDWIRRHALEYDKELAAILGDVRPDRRRRAGPV